MFQAFLTFLAQAPGGSGGGMTLIMGYVAIFMAIMYFMMIRPQQRRDKDRRAMITNLKKGNRVMFCGGLLGQIQSHRENDNVYVIKVADNVKIEVHQDAINSLVEKPGSTDDKAESAKDKK